MMHAAAALAAALFVTPAADRGDDVSIRSQIVSHADLDLREARDVERLDLRIARTARALCGEASMFDVAGRRKARTCVDDAVARAAAQRARAIDDTRVTMVAGR